MREKSIGPWSPPIVTRLWLRKSDVSCSTLLVFVFGSFNNLNLLLLTSDYSRDSRGKPYPPHWRKRSKTTSSLSFVLVDARSITALLLFEGSVLVRSAAWQLKKGELKKLNWDSETPDLLFDTLWLVSVVCEKKDFFFFKPLGNVLCVWKGSAGIFFWTENYLFCFFVFFNMFLAAQKIQRRTLVPDGSDL